MWTSYGCMCAFDDCMLMYVAVIEVSSAQVMSVVCLGGVGMSEVYMLKSVVEMIPP